MELISVIIPAREERWLNDTILGVLDRFKSKPEIIVTLDGKDEKRLDGVRYIYNKEPRGMRAAINQAVEIATGKYLMKLDAHCMVGKHIDERLIKEHHSNWVQIPRRKRLDAKSWTLIEGKLDIDYMYMNKDFIGIINRGKNADEELKKKLIDDTETFQGSCYFITKEYFNKLGLLDDKNFAGSGHEAQEITLKVRCDGGRIIRNKKTWYAHARMWRFYSTDRTKSRNYIKILANENKVS